MSIPHNIDFGLINAWPFMEAEKLLRRVRKEKDYHDNRVVIFETGYGPSGLPHIGTFGEVVRTSMVMRAFQEIAPNPTELYCFSDDMDGLRKVPDNVPNTDLIQKYIGRPLTQVPDPFGEESSFGESNNLRLRQFLDQFGFRYSFKSATDLYNSGFFDSILLKVLEKYDEIMDVVLPSLGRINPERKDSYSPFMPISNISGCVLQTRILERNISKGTVVFEEEDGSIVETPVTGGRCKLQWKVDWAMRWAAFPVDYEMYGKDLISSYELSSRICNILGQHPPDGVAYELFLDEGGQKISKSRGNGLSIEEWLKYAPEEVLTFYMYQKPQAAKRLHYDIIPRFIDDYDKHLSNIISQSCEEVYNNPIWHVHKGKVPDDTPNSITFAMLLNLISASGARDKNIIWEFIHKYHSDIPEVLVNTIDARIDYAMRFCHDFILPSRRYHTPSEQERDAIIDLRSDLAKVLDDTPDGDALQNIIYDIGKRHNFNPMKLWFQALYSILLGQQHGPRFGSFIAIYGIDRTLTLIDKALSGELS